MNSFLIFSFEYKEKKKHTNATVIFCSGTKIDIDQLQDEIKLFYSTSYQTEKTIIIGPSYLNADLKNIYNSKEKVFKYVPLKEETSLYENLYFLEFDINGEVFHSKDIENNEIKYFDDFKTSFHQEGLQKIFIDRGGLVESASNHHHFVFPSGKHCEKFLRVANILLYSSEINFIAFGLLKFFKNNEYDYIYCDTSSINSVAIALNNIRKSFNLNQNDLPIISFKSYEGLYNESSIIKPNSLILISASTSGSIINYILSKHPDLNSKNIVLLYYLENKNSNNVTLEQVLCNLTYSDSNRNGIHKFTTSEELDCKLCADGSYAIEISGDVFLLEKPKVRSILIQGKDINERDSPFINQFMSINKESSILRVNYKEVTEEFTQNRKYEVYIDYQTVIRNIEDKRFKNHKEKLDSFIDQYVPSNTRYILHLNDKSSELLANHIQKKIENNYQEKLRPRVINKLNFNKIPKDSEGSIVIVASCISNGKNLLYLSRALRNYKLRIVYFIAINRYSNLILNKELKSNLKYGRFGPENSSFVEIESINCSSLSLNNSWQIEEELLKKKLSFLKNELTKKFVMNRIKEIEEGYSDDIRGMSNNIFLPCLLKNGSYKALDIRRNSAFYSMTGYEKHVSQSDVYFNISQVINNLRCSTNNSHNLRQSMYVRNLLSPGNLNRFNDGIIQASILRCSRKEELSYGIDNELSNEMFNILITIIKYWDQEQGEALLEFLNALATKKLTLTINHIRIVVDALKTIGVEIITFYAELIEEIYFKKELANNRSLF